MILDLGNVTRSGLTLDRVSHSETLGKRGGGGRKMDKLLKEQRVQDQKEGSQRQRPLTCVMVK